MDSNFWFIALAIIAAALSRIVLVLMQVTSIGDIGALTSGAAEAADPARRGAALAVYAFTGYVIAFAGTVVAGVALAVCAVAAARPHDRRA